MKTPEPDDFEKDLEKDLEEGPLQRKGFTSKLQQDIEETIRRKERTKSVAKPLLIFTGFGIALSAVLLFPWHSLHTRSEAIALEGPPMSAVAASTVPPAPINTALLIGLRTEQTPAANGTKSVLSPLKYSTYRTMLIAPVRGQLQKTAEGTGILMPYKQNFWKIDSLTHITSKGESHYLTAHMADQPLKQERFVDPPDTEFNRVETLLFAGNQYVSVAETEDAWSGNAPYRADRIWVRTLLQLKEPRTLQFYKKPVDKNHVSLTDIYGSNVSSSIVSKPTLEDPTFSEITGQSWTIQREPGKWVGKVASTPRTTMSAPDRYVLHDITPELPDKVSNHDDLCCSWSNIKTSWPRATDALTSPMDDMLVIFEEGKLNFYSYGQAPGSKPQLTLDLQPGEQLVMAQWATDHYVQEWIDKVGRYLSPVSAPEAAAQQQVSVVTAAAH